jgi:hypothetical protein
MRSTAISRQTLQRANYTNVLRLAKWLKLDLVSKTKKQILDAVTMAAARSDKYHYIHGS